MKKILLSLVLLLVAGIANAQSKEETIAKLKNDFWQYLKGIDSWETDVKLVDINECEFTLSAVIVDEKKHEKHRLVQVIPTRAICDSTYQGFSSADGEKTVRRFYDDEEQNSSASTSFTLEKREQKRILAELDHLASFCTKKIVPRKNTYYEF